MAKEVEVTEMEILECDGRTATAKFSVWSPSADKIVTVTALYRRGDNYLTVGMGKGGARDAELYVMTSRLCMEDVKEACAYQRDLNRARS